jgi:hypothetical protein
MNLRHASYTSEPSEVLFAFCRTVQQISRLSMDPASRHVAVLSHGDMGVAEMIGPDAGPKPSSSV